MTSLGHLLQSSANLFPYRFLPIYLLDLNFYILIHCQVSSLRLMFLVQYDVPLVHPCSTFVYLSDRPLVRGSQEYKSSVLDFSLYGKFIMPDISVVILLCMFVGLYIHSMMRR